ncbi:hypothetical protein ABE244_25630 [Bacillus toyonensis]|uniref:hypothetical protein n=1 Tax=Bacillus toyonensis TaxID=155322 RepID=UPI003D25F499
MNHFMNDLYPNMGYMNTGFQTIAEAEDQKSLVDDQKLATDIKVKQDPVKSGHIYKSVLIVLAIALALGYFGRGL